MTRAPYDNEPVSLRDYFAGKAPMPNAAEAAEIMGCQCRENTPRPRPIANTPEPDAWVALPSFDELWKKLPNLERVKVCAKFQFMYADAMLAARAPQPEPTPPASTPDVEELCDE
jgi:hypothetical protein